MANWESELTCLLSESSWRASHRPRNRSNGSFTFWVLLQFLLILSSPCAADCPLRWFSHNYEAPFWFAVRTLSRLSRGNTPSPLALHCQQVRRHELSKRKRPVKPTYNRKLALMLGGITILGIWHWSFSRPNTGQCRHIRSSTRRREQGEALTRLHRPPRKELASEILFDRSSGFQIPGNWSSIQVFLIQNTQNRDGGAIRAKTRWINPSDSRFKFFHPHWAPYWGTSEWVSG